MRRIQSAFLALALSLCFIVTVTNPLYAQPEKSLIAQSMENRVHLWLCNKGKVPVEVVIVDVDADLREVLQGRVPAQYWRVAGQTLAPTGGCKDVYSDRGSLQPIFIGFGFKNSRGQFVSGRVPTVPDLGNYDFGLAAAAITHRTSIPIMQRATGGRTVCVHADAAYWKSPNQTFPDSGGNCSGFSVSGDAEDPGTGPFYPVTLALDFHPQPSECSDPPAGAPADRGIVCLYGEYYIAVAADPATGDITVLPATASGVPIDPAEQKRLDAENKRNEEEANRMLADAVANVRKAQDEAENRQLVAEHTRNRMLVHELAKFSPAWASGQVAYVRGTVSRVEPSPDGRQQPARVYFQDTDGFDVCIFPQLISNPEHYVGQRLEVRGRIIRQQLGDRPAEMQVMLPTAIFELAKGEPPDEAILPGMDPSMALGSPLPTHTDAEYRQMAINRPMNGRPRTANVGTAGSSPITPGQRIFLTLLDAIHLDHAMEGSTYRAQIERPIDMVDGTTLQAGGIAILKFWRTPMAGSSLAMTVNIAVQSIGINGQQVPIATSPFVEVLPVSPDGATPSILRPRMHLGFTVTAPNASAPNVAPPSRGTPR